LAHLAQHFVPSEVPRNVIDLLEAIQIEKREPVPRLVGDRAGQGCGEPPLELTPVHQTGEGIAGRSPGQGERCLPGGGHITRDQKAPCETPLPVPHRCY
jgi:hypothetical protein